jgi:hypothetical protein
MIYIAFKMPDVAAGSGGKSSESSRKHPTFHGAPNWCNVRMAAGWWHVL